MDFPECCVISLGDDFPVTNKNGTDERAVSYKSPALRGKLKAAMHGISLFHQER
jgi:hypothetical protein